MATRKPQVGWRHPNADKDLMAEMFRFGYVKRIHLAPHGKVTEIWTNFIEELFNTQEGFMGKEKTSVRAVRQQWDARIELFKKTMGWEDGHCQNLSALSRGQTSNRYRRLLESKDAIVLHRIPHQQVLHQAERCLNNYSQ